MGSYVAFYLAGLYPLPATRQILLSSPYFPQISFRNPVLNTTTTIRANGFRGNPENGTGGHVFVKVSLLRGVRGITSADQNHPDDLHRASPSMVRPGSPTVSLIGMSLRRALSLNWNSPMILVFHAEPTRAPFRLHSLPAGTIELHTVTLAHNARIISIVSVIRVPMPSDALGLVIIAAPEAVLIKVARCMSQRLSKARPCHTGYAR